LAAEGCSDSKKPLAYAMRLRVEATWKQNRSPEVRGCPLARSDGAMDRPAVANQIGCLAGKVERILNRFGKFAAGGERAGRHVAVCAAREGIGMPIVQP